MLTGKTGIVLVEDVARAVGLGLSAVAASALRRAVPAVPGDEAEVSVRRRLLAGAPAVLVMEGPRVMGAVSRSAIRGAAVGTSLAARFASRLAPDVLRLLAEVGRFADEARSRAFAVGGVVRDLLVDGPADAGAGRRDVDVVVEGDGLGVARRTARKFGATLTVHDAFGTASLAGLAVERLDVATARREHYAAPGALPTVRGGRILDDLERRDFSVNAMAVELSSGAFGLLDPTGGRQDIVLRRIRVLHPVSFVEDPTRVFRAVRYATRLGFRLDRPSLRALSLALRLAPYPALSGRRIAAEVERVLDDSAPGSALGRLAALGAFRLLDPRFRASPGLRARLAALEAATAWLRRRRLAATTLELTALAIVADQRAEVAASALRRLGFSGGPLERLLRALERAPALVERLVPARGGPPSGRAAALREGSAVDLAWAWWSGGDAVRAEVDWYLESAARVSGELRGDDLLDLGVPRGPAIGLTLRKLRDARIDGEVRSREDEVARVGEWRGRLGAPDGTRATEEG